MDAQRRLLFRPDLAEFILEDRILPSSSPSVSTTGRGSAGYVIIASLLGLSPVLNSITGVRGGSSAGSPSSTGSGASSPATGNGSRGAGSLGRTGSGAGVGTGVGAAGGIPIVIRKAPPRKSGRRTDHDSPAVARRASAGGGW